MQAGLPSLETARLRLRPCRQDDIDVLHQIWTDPGVRKYVWDDQIIGRQQAAEVVETSMAQFQQQGDGIWVMMPSQQETRIGFCGFWLFHQPAQLELLYGLVPTHWNTGLATEATRALLRFGFEERGFTTITASTDAPNTASIRVMEKIGMRFHKRELSNGLDTIYYTIARKAFRWSGEPYQLEWRREKI